MAKSKTPKRNSKGRFVKRGSTARRRKTRRNPSTKRKSTSTSSSAKRKAAARKAARTRLANKRKRSAAARKAARTRRRSNPTRRRTASRPTGAARSYRRNPSPKRRRPATKRRRASPARRRASTARRRYRRNPARYRDAAGRFTKQRGVPTLARARKYIKSPPSGPAKAYKKRFKMRTNPASMIDAVLQAVPVAGGLYASRYITNRLGPRIPGMDALGKFRGPAQAGIFALLVHYGTRRFRFQYRGAAVMGAGINLVDSVVQAFAPPKYARAFGIASAPESLPPVEEGGEGVGEYLQVGEYMQVGPGGPPVDSSLSLGEYVSVDGIEADLGAIESDLGYEGVRAALGDGGNGGFSDRNLGGVSRGAHGRARARRMRSAAAVPRRSMTAPVDHFGPDDNAQDQLYTGIFSGGGSIGG